MGSNGSRHFVAGAMIAAILAAAIVIGWEAAAQQGAPTQPEKDYNQRSLEGAPARGEFDPFGNYWAGGRGGYLIEFNTIEKRIHEYRVPTPYVSLYTAKADKNGEVWAGELQGGRYLRFNPKTVQWTEYVLPEPYGHDRESWIDNSTDPVTVWYVDHEGYIVRIQPLE